ncbi:hypothetical protein [Alicyclobacillus suci]|uniref:hypothetical protein n=1 Tax=Alicyclobacillus suci TaxID=2816080 RepID=UPI001F413997|nr:hypothetical protein [Alicyclobacillus suci]
MPSMTARYDLAEGSHGTFFISSSTEKYAIDRIESKRALDLHEQIAHYQMIVDSIDKALKRELTKNARLWKCGTSSSGLYGEPLRHWDTARRIFL